MFDCAVKRNEPVMSEISVPPISLVIFDQGGAVTASFFGSACREARAADGVIHPDVLFCSRHR